MNNRCPFCHSEQIELDEDTGLMVCYDCDNEWRITK